MHHPAKLQTLSYVIKNLVNIIHQLITNKIDGYMQTCQPNKEKLLLFNNTEPPKKRPTILLLQSTNNNLRVLVCTGMISTSSSLIRGFRFESQIWNRLYLEAVYSHVGLPHANLESDGPQCEYRTPNEKPGKTHKNKSSLMHTQSTMYSHRVRGRVTTLGV